MYKTVTALAFAIATLAAGVSHQSKPLDPIPTGFCHGAGDPCKTGVGNLCLEGQGAGPNGWRCVCSVEGYFRPWHAHSCEEANNRVGCNDGNPEGEPPCLSHAENDATGY
eukprot:CAMPEP_0175165694 /NCGR_PEP_ID=MMETSP0087-20121206/27243_1 /TAXON_ID=136419 /ORGANISM="Unknown Unknown, Strain D1" /LENGTH=109 /DNA_ID=CAMNT_0016455129 /DNA_START=23 /DNA_END=352 /DNA_ORIENTATION=-